MAPAKRSGGPLGPRLAARRAGGGPAVGAPTAAAHRRPVATDILAEHLNLRRGDNAGAMVALLLSTDFGTAMVALLLSTDFGTRRLYNGAPLWMTVADNGFRSAADVAAWCASRFPTLSGALLQDHCTPRRLEAPVA